MGSSGNNDLTLEYAAPQAKAILGARRVGDSIKVILRLDIPVGFHAYAPGASDGLPLLLSVGEGFEAIEDLKLDTDVEHISGLVFITFSTRGDAEKLVASLRVQLCDDLTCLAPQTLALSCHIHAAA